MNIAELIKNNRIRTPSYIWDIDALDEHLQKVCNIANEIGKEKVELCYAMKANPIIMRHISSNVKHIEVCSPGEFDICRDLNIPGEKIILSGVNKDAHMIKSAIEYGVDIITVESLQQYNHIKTLAENLTSVVRILPRLSNGAQFGMTENDIAYVVEDSMSVSYLYTIGIHFFSGTQKKSVEKDKDEIDHVVKFICKLHDSYGFSPELFEYGPGLKAPYFVGDDFDDIYKDFSDIIAYIEKLNLDYKIGIELGRYLAFNSTSYCTTVDDVKNTDDTNICIVDGGIHHINYYGQNMAMRTPIMEHIKRFDDTEMADDLKVDLRICGSLCTFADVLVRKVSLSDVKIGDVLVFHNVGAYSMTEAPALFLSRKLPYIYSYSKANGLKIIREAQDTYLINLGRDL